MRTWFEQRGAGHRGFALALVLAVIVLMAISLYLFAVNLSQGAPNQQSTLTKIINGVPLTKSEEAAFGDEESHMSLTFSADKLDVASNRLTGNLRFELPPGIQSDIVDTNKNNAKVFNCPSSGACHIKPQYANEKVNIQMITSGADTGVESEYSHDVPLSTIDASPLGRAVLPVDIPLSGFPDLYPQDYYFFDVYMSFTLPDGLDHLVNGTQTPTGIAKDFYSFDPGNASETMSSAVTLLRDNKGKPVDGNFHISFNRRTRDILYVFAVALIPLIFGFLFLHLLFFSRHFQHKIFEEFTEALIVAILAVLPLRAVLVPAEISGLTRVDLVLGIGLVLIVGVAVGKYATEIWAAGDGQGGPGGGGQAAMPMGPTHPFIEHTPEIERHESAGPQGSPGPV